MKPADIATLARGERTRQSILDAAEVLFSAENYDAISIRNVADRAEVKFGLITYHFKNKENLFEAVATRKSLEITRRRTELLEALEAPGVNGILDAFMRPVVELLPLPEWRPYLRLISAIGGDSRWNWLAEKLFRDNSMTFVVALEKVMPGVPEEAIVRGFSYALSVLAGMTQYGAAMNALTIESYATDDYQRIYATMLPFVTGGMEAIAEAHRAQP